MFEYCVNPDSLEGFFWLSCYVTTPKHMSFYVYFLVVMFLLALAAPLAMAFGFLGAIASRSSKSFIKIIGKGYLAMIRGIPDIVFYWYSEPFRPKPPNRTSWVVLSSLLQ